MSQTLKQAARQRAAQQFQKRREEHLAREARIRDLVVEATTALLERERVITESVTGIIRAGAQVVLTYWARELAEGSRR